MLKCFYMNVLMAAWNIEFVFVLQASWEREEVTGRNGVMRELIATCVVGHARGYVRSM